MTSASDKLRIAHLHEHLARMAAFVQKDQTVWYHPTPKERYPAIVDTNPREEGTGYWVVDLRELPPAFSEAFPHRSARVKSAAIWFLAPRSMGDS